MNKNASQESLQGKNSHIAAHRINSKLCHEKDKPPSGWKPVVNDISSYLEIAEKKGTE
jgi:hypothetical protein